MIFGLVLLAGCDQQALKTPKEFEHLYGLEHDFQTLGVEDQCFDGALEILFMPEGANNPHEFEYPIYMPLLEETPYQGSVDFREPFVGMDVNIVGDDTGQLSIDGAVMGAVSLGGSFADCVADMTVNAEFSPTQDGFSGIANIQISNLQSSEGACPVSSDDVCQVVLQLRTSPSQ